MDEEKKELELENEGYSEESLNNAADALGKVADEYLGKSDPEPSAMENENGGEAGSEPYGEKTYSTQTERMEEEFRRQRESRGNYSGNPEGNYDSNIYGSGGFYDGADRNPGNGNLGISIASMVCGILSILCCCSGWFGIVLAVVALVLGIIGVRHNYSGREMAIAGIVTGGCGLVLCLVLLIFATIVSGLSNTFVKDSLQFYNFDLDGLDEIL